MGADTGYLTTHVLDTARGQPAAGLKIELFWIDGDARKRLAVFETNRDGRTDAPVLAKGSLTTGTYELVFHAGAYLKATGMCNGPPPFLDLIPVRFGVADADEHYHVPLLLAPYSYATYRGS